MSFMCSDCGEDHYPNCGIKISQKERDYNRKVAQYAALVERRRKEHPIRFYHWWIYKLYYRFWNPIYKVRPEMVQSTIVWMSEYLDNVEKVQKPGMTDGDKLEK